VRANGRSEVGAGTFTDATAARLPPSSDFTNAVALGEVDWDGDRDLVFANNSIIAPQNRLYLNLLRQLDVPYLVRPGHSYQLDIYARYGPPHPLDIAVVMLSAGAARIPIPPYGTFGLNPRLMVALPQLVIPHPAGVNTVSCPVPNAPSLAGLSIYAQALLMQDPVAISLTNWTCDQIVR
jgi:hypothetical protein